MLITSTSHARVGSAAWVFRSLLGRVQGRTKDIMPAGAGGRWLVEPGLSCCEGGGPCPGSLRACRGRVVKSRTVCQAAEVSLLASACLSFRACMSQHSGRVGPTLAQTSLTLEASAQFASLSIWASPSPLSSPTHCDDSDHACHDNCRP